MKKNTKIIIIVISCFFLVAVIAATWFIVVNKKISIFSTSPKLTVEQLKQQVELVQSEKIKQQAADYVKQRLLFAKGEFNECKEEVGEKNINDCYYQGASLSGDQSWCDKIDTAQDKQHCYDLFTFARITKENKDPAACLALAIDFKGSCLDSFFMSYQDVNECNQFQDNFKSRCLDLVLSSTAFRQGDVKLCDKVNDVTLKINCQEQIAAKSKDTDGDGIPDALERSYGTNPFDKDSDHDGLMDYEEVNIYHTDPRNADTDADGHNDGEEVKNGFNPCGVGKIPEANQLINECAKYLK